MRNALRTASVLTLAAWVTPMVVIPDPCVVCQQTGCWWCLLMFCGCA